MNAPLSDTSTSLCTRRIYKHPSFGQRLTLNLHHHSWRIYPQHSQACHVRASKPFPLKTVGQSGEQSTHKTQRRACVELSDCQAVERARERSAVSVVFTNAASPWQRKECSPAHGQLKAQVARSKTSIFHWNVFPGSQKMLFKKSAPAGKSCILRVACEDRIKFEYKLILFSDRQQFWG